MSCLWRNFDKNSTLARGSKPHAISTNVFRGRMAKKTSLIQQIQRHVEKKRMQSNLCSSRNFCLHYRMNGNWEAKCWRLHAELHLRNYIGKTRVWRVKIEGNDEPLAFPSQGVEIVCGLTVAQEVSFITKVDSSVMPTSREAPIQFSPLILHWKFPFLEMCWRLMHRGHWHWRFLKTPR